MAIEKIHTAAENITVAAAENLAPYQYHAVKIFPTGVIRATTAAGSGWAYVLYNKPSSGQAATLIGAPNVAKAISGTAVAIGEAITVGASATFVVTSWYNPLASLSGTMPIVGQAITAAVSGGIFSLRLL